MHTASETTSEELHLSPRDGTDAATSLLIPRFHVAGRGLGNFNSRQSPDTHRHEINNVKGPRCRYL